MQKSPNWSWYGWNLWRFVKGRKKTAITVLGALLGWFISDSFLVASLSAGIVEIAFALAEFYFKKVDL